MRDNELVAWAKTGEATLLAAQLPGRGKRIKENLMRSAEEVARGVAPALSTSLGDAPYVIVCHSMGCLVAYQTLLALRAVGASMPQHLFLSCFPPPDRDRHHNEHDIAPWARNADLTDEAFQVECRKWGVNKMLFEPDVWSEYSPRLRADFDIFDSYHFEPGHAPFDFPITAWFATGDDMVKEEHVAQWERFTTGTFELRRLDGPHLFHYKESARADQFRQIAEVGARYAGC